MGWWGERKQGKGCGHCGFVGLIGRQLVVDVWEVNDGVPVKVACKLEQGRALVDQGLVARETVVDAFGPSGWGSVGVDRRPQ